MGVRTDWSIEQVVSRGEILSLMRGWYGLLETAKSGRAVPLSVSDWGTAPLLRGSSPRLRHPSVAVVIEAVSPATARYCSASTPNRGDEEALRLGATDDEKIAERIAVAWSLRTDRGAEVRAQAPGRGDYIRSKSLRPNPREGDGTPGRSTASRWPSSAADPSQHRQYRSTLRSDRQLAPSDRAAGSLDSEQRNGAGRASTIWDDVGPRVHPDWCPLSAMRWDRSRCLYSSAKVERSHWQAPDRRDSCLVLERDRRDAAVHFGKDTPNNAPEFLCPGRSEA